MGVVAPGEKNDQITVSFVRAAGVRAKSRMRPAGRMVDMPDLNDRNVTIPN